MAAQTLNNPPFEALLNQCAKINFDENASDDIDLHQRLKNIDKTYAEIKTDICSEIENHAIVSDILTHSRYNSALNRVDFYRNIHRGAIRKASLFTRFEMDERLIPFNSAKGDWHYKKGEYEQALAAWRDVLKVDPNNAIVYANITKLINGAQENADVLKQKASSLIQKHTIKHETSFGNDRLQYPTSLLYSQRHKVLLVSDASKDQIHKFSIAGHYKGSISLGLNKPWGVFLDVDDNFWVCDWGNATLKKFDIGGVLQKKVDIGSIAASAKDIVYPRFGAICSGKMYVVLTDPSSYSARRLICWDGETSTEIVVAGASLINDIKAIKDRLYVSCLTTGKIFYFEPECDRLVPISHFGERPLSSFALKDDAILLMANGGRSILKMNLSNEHIFLKKDIRDMISEAFSLHMVTSAKIGEQWNMFACDPHKKLIHVLNV